MHSDLREITDNLNKNEEVADAFNAYTKTALFHDQNVKINTTILKTHYNTSLLQPLPFS